MKRARVVAKRVDTILDTDILTLRRPGSNDDVSVTWADAAKQIVQEVAAARQAMVDNYNTAQVNLQNAVGMIEAQQQTIASQQAELAALQSAMNERVADIESIQSAVATRAQVIDLPEITLTQQATIAINAGVRTLPLFTIAGLKAGDRTLVFPKSALPTGYYVVSVIATADTKLQVSLQAPLLAIGATYSIPCRVVVIR